MERGPSGQPLGERRHACRTPVATPAAEASAALSVPTPMTATAELTAMPRPSDLREPKIEVDCWLVCFVVFMTFTQRPVSMSFL